MYIYYEPKSSSILTVSGDKAYTIPRRGHPDIFMDPRFNLSDQKLSNMALLSSNCIATDCIILRARDHKRVRDTHLCLLVY